MVNTRSISLFLTALLTLFLGDVLLGLGDILAAELPGYANKGNLKQDIETRGEAMTDILALIAVIVCIMGMIWGAIKIGTGDPDKGKQFLGGGIIGCIIVAIVYGLASLALKGN